MKGVYNTVTVQPSHMRAEVRSEIEAALKRNAEIEARHITFSVLVGNRVILSGETDSFLKKIAAERAAWKAPGVMWVENNILVLPVSRIATQLKAEEVKHQPVAATRGVSWGVLYQTPSLGTPLRVPFCRLCCPK